jgi:hypothetical protein
MSSHVNVLALVKRSEKYIFLYDDESCHSILEKLKEYASNKDLSFSWYDADVLSQKVRRVNKERNLRLEHIFKNLD